MSKRIEWVDIVKYICIIFVIVHHLETASEVVYVFYASFFLKAFFFTAGYVHRHTDDFKGFMLKKVKCLFVPWLIFSVLNILLSQVLSFNEHNDLITELGWNMLQIRNHGDGIWFVAALFITFIPFYFIIKWGEKSNKRVAVIGISFLLSLGSLIYTEVMNPALLPWNSVELPWHLEYVFQAMFFMVLGYYFRKEYEEKFDKYNTRVNRICLAVVYLVLVYVPYVCGIEFPNAIDIVYQYIREFAGVMLLIAVCKIVKTNGYVSYVGQNTLICFALHGKVLSVLQTIIRKLIPNLYETILESSVASGIFAIVFAVVISVVLIIPAWIINNYLPWMVGRKKKKKV